MTSFNPSQPPRAPHLLPRAPRRLEYIKCEFCRRSKKKCEPSKRQWPGTKCRRCDSKGFSCSTPAKKNVSEADSNLLVARSNQDHLHEQRAYCALAEKCIQEMRGGLRRNICKLPSTKLEIGTIHRSQIDDMLPEELRYACIFWVTHLHRGRNTFLVNVNLQDQVYDFLRGYFLYWVEALSLLQLVQEGIESLESLEKLVNAMDTTSSENLRGDVHNAKRFVMNYRADIEQSPLNIYSNALQCELSGLMKEIHIPSITCSSDGKMLATASIDSTVKSWDPTARIKRQTFKGHTESITPKNTTDLEQIAAAAALAELHRPKTGTEGEKDQT